jgi:chromosome partitioning protein
MAHVVAVANQKGGVGKTTTVHSLGYALAESGLRVLIVDLDPQACLTYSTGLDPSSLPVSLHDVFARTMKAADVRYMVTGIDGLDILPATIDLASTEVQLLTRPSREHVLRRALKGLDDEYEMIIIDCPPSLGILSINGLCAADEVVIPLQCETLCNRGVGQLLEMIADVRMFANADLKIRGIINTLYDDRTSHGRVMLADVKERYGLEVLDPPVRKSVRFAEAPEFGRCILQHAPSSAGAEAYRALARELQGERCLVG